MPFLNTLLLLQLRICTCVGRREHLTQTLLHVKTNTFEIQKYFFKEQYKALILTQESRSECTFAIRPTNVTAYTVFSLEGYIFKKAQGFVEEILPSLFDVKDSFAFDFIQAKILFHVFPEILCDSANSSTTSGSQKKNQKTNHPTKIPQKLTKNPNRKQSPRNISL